MYVWADSDDVFRYMLQELIDSYDGGDHNEVKIPRVTEEAIRSSFFPLGIWLIIHDPWIAPDGSCCQERV